MRKIRKVDSAEHSGTRDCGTYFLFRNEEAKRSAVSMALDGEELGLSPMVAQTAGLTKDEPFDEKHDRRARRPNRPRDARGVWTGRLAGELATSYRRLVDGSRLLPGSRRDGGGIRPNPSRGHRLGRSRADPPAFPTNQRAATRTRKSARIRFRMIGGSFDLASPAPRAWQRILADS